MKRHIGEFNKSEDVWCCALHVTRHTSHITHHMSHTTHHTPHITHHTSHITHHTSHITHHTSHITHHTSHIPRCPSCLTSPLRYEMVMRRDEQQRVGRRERGRGGVDHEDETQVTHHTSHVTHHTSHITHHTSHVTQSQQSRVDYAPDLVIRLLRQQIHQITQDVKVMRQQVLDPPQPSAPLLPSNPKP
jgi:hypothetical protein